MKINPNENSLVHPTANSFFQWINGKLPVKDKNNPTLIELTSGYPLRATKAVWGLYLPLQIIGLFNERAGKLARAFYGACWSIVYSCYRPFAANRKTLGGDKASPTIKNLYNINENFRLGMGTLVSAVYGGGAFGMLWGAITGNDDFFDKSAEVYTTGMLNQNQIFASMNTEVVLSRKYNNTDEQLSKTNQQKGCFKSGIELTDAILFIPNIITRGLDTFRLFGMELGEGTKKIVNALGYFSYGTWAAKFGKLKTLKAQVVNGQESGGDLEILNPELKGTATGLDKTLQETQEMSGKVFHTLLPAISWASTALELFGLSELAQKVFKLEGILERLHPTIASWCIRDTWLKLFRLKEEKPAINQQEIQIHEQQTATQVDEKEKPATISLLSQDVSVLSGVTRDWNVIKRNGDKVKVPVAGSTVTTSTALLARKYNLDQQRLLDSIKYETEIRQQFSQPVIDLQEQFYPCGVDGEKPDLSKDLRSVAQELETKERAVLFALKREQYYDKHGEYGYFTRQGIESALMEGSMACVG